MMMKKNRLHIFFLLLLIFMTASFAHAANVSGVQSMDAWKYMQGELTASEYQRFIQTFGDGEGNFSGEKRAAYDEQKKNDMIAIMTEGSEAIRKIEKRDCFQGKNGKKLCMDVGKNEVAVTGNSFTSRCGIVEVHWYNHSKCLFCPLIGIIYSLVDKITIISYGYSGQSFAILAIMILLLWIAVKTLIFVSAMTKQDAAKYITENIQQIFKFLIAFFALTYYGNIFQYILLPLLNAGLEFGNTIVGGGSLSERLGSEMAANIASNNTDAIAAAGESMPEAYKNNLNNTYFSLSTLAQLEGFVYNVNSNYSLLQAIGSRLMCVGFRFMLTVVNFGVGFTCIINGIVYFVTGFLLSIVFAFYMLDAVVQLGMVGALLPFMIACWPFKITSKYTGNGFKMFLNSLFTFMMVGVICSLSMELINQAAGGDSATGITPNNGFAELIEAINEADKDKLKVRVNVFSMGFIIIVFACYISFMVIGKVNEITSKFAGGGLKPMATSIATMGASFAKGAVKKISAPTRKAISKRAERGTKAFYSGIGKGLGWGGRKISEGIKGAKKFLGFGKKGQDGDSGDGGGSDSGKSKQNAYENGKRENPKDLS